MRDVTYVFEYVSVKLHERRMAHRWSRPWWHVEVHSWLFIFVMIYLILFINEFVMTVYFYNSMCLPWFLTILSMNVFRVASIKMQPRLTCFIFIGLVSCILNHHQVVGFFLFCFYVFNKGTSSFNPARDQKRTQLDLKQAQYLNISIWCINQW